MEVLAGFVLGYILGTDAGGKGISVMKDALGSVAASDEVQSVMSTGASSAQGLLGGVLGGGGTGGSVKDAISTMAASEEVRSLVSVGFSTAQELASGLFERGRELVADQVASQRSRGLRLVN